MTAPRRDRSSSCRCYRRGDFIEQRDLACGSIAMRGRRRDERFIDAGKKFRALATKKIERSGFNQALKHFSICEARAKSLAEIFQLGYYWETKILLTAVKLDVFSALDGKRKTLRDLADRLNCAMATHSRPPRACSKDPSSDDGSKLSPPL